MILTYPSRCEGNQRKPEKEVQIRPHHPTGHMFGGMEHVMMIVPVDADINEAQDIVEKNRQQGLQPFRSRHLRNL